MIWRSIIQQNLFFHYSKNIIMCLYLYFSLGNAVALSNNQKPHVGAREAKPSLQSYRLPPVYIRLSTDPISRCCSQSGTYRKRFCYLWSYLFPTAAMKLKKLIPHYSSATRWVNKTRALIKLLSPFTSATFG